MQRVLDKRMDLSTEVNKSGDLLLENKDIHLKIIFEAAVEQGRPGTCVVGHDGHQEE